LVVKVYEQGNMSKHLDNLTTGDTILCKGPIKKLPYEANMKKKICMIAGADLCFLSYSFFQVLFLS
jgi:cytochrome-b5 reductase